MKKIQAVFILSIFLWSCSNSPVYYKYNGITITRLDKINGEAETHFFYGYCDGKGHPYPKSFIKVTYHGFDAFMDGYLMFLPNNKVELIEKDGAFQKVGNDTNLTLTAMDIVKFDNWHDSIQNKYKNITYFTAYDSTNEKTDNVKNHSDVKAEYSR